MSVGSDKKRAELTLSPRQHTILQAYRAGKFDEMNNRGPDPARYAANPGSAWADWYAAGYEGEDLPSDMPEGIKV